MMEHKKAAHRDVLKRLIAMAQGLMMDGHGNDEAAGSHIADSMKEEASEGPVEESAEQTPTADESDADFQDYKKKEMKRGPRSPMQARRVAVIMQAKAAGKRA